MHFVENVFPHAARFIDEGQPVALVTLIHVDGSSPRPVGSMIAVAADGRAVGMITGGCAEKAIIAEALQCIQNGENKIVRYGAGSPYLDVVLPCGAGIDLLIDAVSAKEVVTAVSALHVKRRAAFLSVDAEAKTAKISRSAPDNSIARLAPDYRILAFGEGANLIAFSTLAQQAGFSVTAFSPDTDALEFLSGANVTGRPIHRDADFTALEIDEYSAVVTLFHEHEWEAPILHAALNSQADYIGALGSRKTHALRLDALGALPQTPRSPAEIHGPVGLDIGAANPNEIALSILAEITGRRRKG